MIFVVIAALIIVIALITNKDRIRNVLIKSGVNLEGLSREMFYAIGVADREYRRIAGIPVTITSAKDQHEDRPESLHNLGQAIDIRIRDLSGMQAQEAWISIRNFLFPEGFDVVLESDHIHIEYDPKIAQGRVFAGVQRV